MIGSASNNLVAYNQINLLTEPNFKISTWDESKYIIPEILSFNNSECFPYYQFGNNLNIDSMF
jgi:hypothetical protein